MAAGLTAGAALVGYGTSRGDILIMGAVTGLGVGALQALVVLLSATAASQAGRGWVIIEEDHGPGLQRRP
jgi:hypothetical protein